MICKINENQLIHQLPAGILVGDHTTELFGCRTTKQVFVLSNGLTKPFSNLSDDKKALLMEKLSDDDKAIGDLLHLPMIKALEQFSFCLYGAADSEADFDEAGNLMKEDNFMCSDNCQCLKWKSKSIKVDGIALTPRELEVIQQLASDLCDKQIAHILGIAESTLDTHKSHIFEKFGVSSTKGMLIKASAQKIIQ